MVNSRVVTITSDFENIKTRFEVNPGSENFYWVFTFKNVQRENFNHRFFKSLQIRDEEDVVQPLEFKSYDEEGGLKLSVRSINTYQDGGQYTLYYSRFNVKKNESKKIKEFFIHLSLDLAKDLISNIFLKILVRVVYRILKTFDDDINGKKDRIAQENIRKVYFSIKDNQVSNAHIDAKVNVVYPKFATFVIANVQSNLDKVSLRYIDVDPSDHELYLKMSYCAPWEGKKFAISILIEAPNGETFGYVGNFLDSAKYCQVGQVQSRLAYSCRSATYSGYLSKIQEITFMKPLEGRWTIKVINAFSRGDVTLSMESKTHSLLPLDIDEGYKVTITKK